MKKRLLGTIALTSLVLAGTATAASGPTITASVTPNKAGAASGFSVSIGGSLPSGVPSQLALIAQSGFTSDGTKAVSAVCTSAQAQSQTCPAGSIVGSGTAGTNLLGPLSFTLAAGKPSQAGDIASVYLLAKVQSAPLTLSGRLFKPSGGGLELLVTGFPQFPGLSFTSMQISAKSTHTVTTYTKKKVKTGKGKKRRTKTVKVAHKTTYSVLRNPSTCPSTGTWSGTVVATYAAPVGTQTIPFTAACTS